MPETDEVLPTGSVRIDGFVHKLKPLTLDELPDFLKVAKQFSKVKEGSKPEEMFDNLDDEGIMAIKRLVEKTLERSLPSTPEDERKRIGMQYLFDILTAMLETTMPMDKSHEELKKKLLKERLHGK